MFINQTPCGDASIYQIQNADVKSLHRIVNKTKGKRKFEILDQEAKNPTKFQKNGEGDLKICKEIKVQDIQRTGAKVVYSSPFQDSRGKGEPYHIFKVLRTKPGRVSKKILNVAFHFSFQNIQI